MNYRNRLPPLQALLVFEAVVRNGGMSSAARELNVTQAAVSKRIKNLEEWLGAHLLARVGRRVTPTAAGRALNEKVATALQFLDDACADVSQGSSVVVSIAGDTAVSHYWLGPKLRAFARAHPNVGIRLVTSDRTADLMAEDIDLAIVAAGSHRPGWRSEPLLEQRLVPVASPAYLAGFAPASDVTRILEAANLLDHDRPEPQWTNWKTWLSKQGGRKRNASFARTFSSYALAIDAAVDGQGIALGSLPLLQQLLDDGRLRAVSNSGVVGGSGFCLCSRAGSWRSPETELLGKWLSAEASRG